jgi:hypothetical protein
VRQLYGETAAIEFGPKALKAVRQRWLDRGQARPTVNKNMRRLTRIFRWAASEELLSVTVHQALATVPGLKRGRTNAPEPPPILPVELSVVERTLPFLPEIVRDMVRIQLLTGMRPGEICTFFVHLIPCVVDCIHSCSRRSIFSAYNLLRLDCASDCSFLTIILLHNSCRIEEQLFSRWLVVPIR